MKPTPDSESVEAARLRAAHDLLDERPRPAVRAAVLREAGRRASADAGAGSPPTPARPMGWRRSGWGPAAAGATAAVGILAVGIALHVERERPAAPRLQLPGPQSSAPVVTPAAAAAPAPAAAPVPEASRAPASPQPARKAAQAPVAPAALAAGNLAPAAADAEEAKPREAASEQRARSSRAAASVVSPDTWLRRIAELRRAGRQAEADQELARFRAAFPGFKVPPEALP